MPWLNWKRWVSAAVLFAGLTALCPAETAHVDIFYGKPYVDVMVNGQGPFRFVVDTGTGADAIITPALAQRLGLEDVGQVRLTDPSGQGEQHTPLVQTTSLVVAGVNFGSVRALRHVLNGEDESCVGLLGFTLFRDYLLTLDFPKRLLTLERGQLAPEGDKDVMTFKAPEGVPVVTLGVGRVWIEAQLDSGGTGLTLPESLAIRVKFSTAPVPYSMGQSVATRFQMKVGRLAEDVRLGQYVFHRPVVEVHPAFPRVNVGAEPLGSFVITFDQMRGLVRLHSEQKKLHLDEVPARMRLMHEPSIRPVDPRLVPVG
ncbi:MAG: retropepsin-like aspartic protease [Terracidiphilus sp.]|nr:retropepsin-like aspartic protease [Terracidiphilus sp.]